MSERPRDLDPILPDERLFRAITKDDVAGERVLPSAFEKQGSSLEREKYLDSPEDAFQYVPEGFTGLDSITENSLPNPIENQNVSRKQGKNPDKDPITWEAFVVDDPIFERDGSSNSPHAELRFRRVSDRPGEENVKPKPAMWLTIRDQLSISAKLAIRPS